MVFKVCKSHFTGPSRFFSEMLSLDLNKPGSSQENPLKLGDISRSDFIQFLRLAWRKCVLLTSLPSLPLISICSGHLELTKDSARTSSSLLSNVQAFGVSSSFARVLSPSSKTATFYPVFICTVTPRWSSSLRNTTSTLGYIPHY